MCLGDLPGLADRLPGAPKLQQRHVHVIHGDHLDQPVARGGHPRLALPRPRPAAVAADVEEEQRVRAVAPEALRHVHLGAVLEGADEPDAVHEVPPLVDHQVLAALQAVEQKVPRPRGELVRVGVTGVVELEGDVGVDAEAEVVVEDPVLGGDLVEGLGVALLVGPGGQGQAPPGRQGYGHSRLAAQNQLESPSSALSQSSV